jgi:hypothetical protein
MQRDASHLVRARDADECAVPRVDICKLVHHRDQVALNVAVIVAGVRPRVALSPATAVQTVARVRVSRSVEQWQNSQVDPAV